MRTVTIVCRLSSRNGLAYYQRLAGELPKRGVKIAEVHMVRRRKDLRARVRGAVASGAEYVVVIGGDGTQTAAVGELAHTKTSLAVVPAGTGNSFAFSLGIKDDLDAAIETIVNGRQIRVDVGVVNGLCFANFAIVGVIADAANRTPTRLKKVLGPIAYGVAAISALFRDRPFRMTVKWRKNRLKLTTYQAIVAGGRYFGWQPVTPNANLRSGKVAFFAAAGDRIVDMIETNAALLTGEHTRLARVHYFSAPKITIRTKPKQPINVDGHKFGKTPAKFTVLNGALRVLVPQDFHDLS